MVEKTEIVLRRIMNGSMSDCDCRCQMRAIAANMFQCYPISENWKGLGGTHKTCINETMMYLGQSSSDAILDRMIEPSRKKHEQLMGLSHDSYCTNTLRRSYVLIYTTTLTGPRSGLCRWEQSRNWE